MIVPNLILFLTGLALAATVRAAAVFRLKPLVQAYAVAAGALALIAAGLSQVRHEPQLLVVAAASFVLKALVMPALIMHVARQSGMSMRLSSRLRPAATYLVVGTLVTIAMVAADRSPFALSTEPVGLLPVGAAIVAIGLAMMIVRRDILSQIVGFLIMENGINAFSIATVRDLSCLVELGILTTLTAGVVMMSIVSRQVREINGTESTQALKELTD